MIISYYRRCLNVKKFLSNSSDMSDAEKSKGAWTQAKPAWALARQRASEHTIADAGPAHAGHERDHDYVELHL
jgi:hypothetical protein